MKMKCYHQIATKNQLRDWFPRADYACTGMSSIFHLKLTGHFKQRFYVPYFLSLFLVLWDWNLGSCFGVLAELVLKLCAAQQLRVSLCPSFTAGRRLFIWMSDRVQRSRFDHIFVIRLRLVMWSSCSKERHWSSPKYISPMHIPKINLFLSSTLEISC